MKFMDRGFIWVEKRLLIVKLHIQQQQQQLIDVKFVINKTKM